MVSKVDSVVGKDRDKEYCFCRRTYLGMVSKVDFVMGTIMIRSTVFVGEPTWVW
jgi:hypothetical protein